MISNASGRLLECRSMKIHRAMAWVQGKVRAGVASRIVYEDSRERKWFGTKGREVLQGAGSIKRDCTIWADFLADMQAEPGEEMGTVQIIGQRPARGVTKWPAKLFQNVTGWTEPTNEHARDAAMLIWGRKWPSMKEAA